MTNRYTKNLQPEGAFTVGEERGLSVALAVVFAGMFLYAVADIFRNPDAGINNRLLLLAVIPAFIFFRKIRSKLVIMKIDAAGFSYYGRRLFTWPQFVSAKVVEEGGTSRFSDNFKLHLKYYREDGNLYHRKLPLSNTQNKAEEEIIAAIRFYSGLGQTP
ncbi:hypothetical protein [Flaviaesturariibacter aridisoli]|uniref:Uncharacterized protein n=1 Tax=Flaviaesturariibacter aridisoli TaxID=2545761 RepID=A0A4R4DVQ4_9BACT|nr:hypothetical protein [Flaviaesturariibacter aridisoli]TCZ64707.1 hypothetical protein E0486_17985 [Flaviaesturariibacter aridisoli]